MQNLLLLLVQCLHQTVVDSCNEWPVHTDANIELMDNCQAFVNCAKTDSNIFFLFHFIYVHTAHTLILLFTFTHTIRTQLPSSWQLLGLGWSRHPSPSAAHTQPLQWETWFKTMVSVFWRLQLSTGSYGDNNVTATFRFLIRGCRRESSYWIIKRQTRSCILFYFQELPT